MKFPLFVLSLAAAASLLASVACGDDDDNADPTPERTPTAEATAAASPTPAVSPTPGSDGVSGIAAVDDAIASMVAGDFQAVEAMFQFQMVACEIDVMGAGGPPQCEADEADGTEVEVFPVAQCEGAFLRADEVFLAERLRDQQMELYAVYDATSAGIYPAGDYAVLFSYVRPEIPGTTLALELMMDDDGVTGVDFGCGEDPATLAEAQGLTDAIVTPEGT
ncbi:MAG: hypothetical protein WEB52_10640 [Dehalococcoidia bacterium]